MSSGPELVIHTDGAARGNPGPAAFAYTIADGDGKIIDEAGCLGTMTNNQAEYIALVRALEHAFRLGTHHKLRIHSDSELLVKQMNGQYRVKDAKLQRYFNEATKLVGAFSDVKIRHVRRSENSRADQLCNDALDGVRSSSDQLPTHSVSSAAPANVDSEVRALLLECIQHAAKSWSQGDPKHPSAESVVNQILKILAIRGA
jgi:ribonuclease HI